MPISRGYAIHQQGGRHILLMFHRKLSGKLEQGRIVVVNDGLHKQILKELIPDITYEMCISKKCFVDYLIINDVPAAKILEYRISNGKIYELQEFVPRRYEKINKKEYVKLLARFHEISTTYGGKYIQKKVLIDDFSINGINLKQVLIGFEEKYYIYPRKVFKRSFSSVRAKEIILDMHEKLYKRIKQYTDFNECIIHNDLTSDNIVLGDRATLIDFDFAIKSTVYVDIADVLFPRTVDIYEYLEMIKNDLFIDEAVNVYNRSQAKMNIVRSGIITMAALKIFVYIMYIYSRMATIDDKLVNYLMDVGRETLSL